MPSVSPPLTLFMIAGEPSGDQLGAALIEGFQTLDLPLQIEGIGGPHMEKAGNFLSQIPFSVLSTMGLDILFHLPQLYRYLQQTIRWVEARQPQILLTIDAPEFSFRVAQGIRNSFTKKIHCVAPSVWAWRPKRAQKIARFLDHLLTLFPFEPPFFEKEGLATTFVGHPLVERPLGNAEIIWKHCPTLSPDRPLLLLVPGSRATEIQNLLPLFLKTAILLREHTPSLQLALPTLPHVRPLVENLLQEQGDLSCWVFDDLSLHSHLWAASRAALAASGTVTLELALAQVPHVTAYRVGSLLAWGLRHLLKTPWVSLPNIILNREVVPECLQERCRPDILAQHLIPLLFQPHAGQTQRQAFQEIAARLRAPLSFGQQAAHVIKGFL